MLSAGVPPADARPIGRHAQGPRLPGRCGGLGRPGDTGRRGGRPIDARIAVYRSNGPTRSRFRPGARCVCTALLAGPDVASTRPVHVAVETRGHTVDRAVMDLREGSAAPPNGDVAFHAGGRFFNQLLVEAFR